MSGAMQQQFDGMKAEFSGVKQRLGDVELRLDKVEHRLTTVEATLHNVVVEQARARGDIEWLKGNMLTRDEFRTAFGVIIGHLEGLAGKFEDSRYSSAKNAERLDEHEKRIAALEAKPS